MKTAKSFDCVQMKNDIQKKAHARRAGMTETQRLADMNKQLESSGSPMAKLWREIKPANVPPSGKAATSV
ncbi:MAG: hypothetical protein JXR37_12965 [Kiritimatiellae bacterium]|nr:hypothetical protein [Kiritimatiellia bacterium]